MLRSIVCLVVGVWICSSGLQAQDIHYSQFFNSPLNLNPALAGVFNGDGRVHANFKEQWSSVPVGYTSGDLGLDLKHGIGKKGHFLGYGLLLNYDRAGDLDLGWTGANTFLSYSLKVKENNYITPGITVGYYQRGFDASNAQTSSQWNGKEIDPTIDAENIGNDGINFLDLGVGLNYRWQKSYRKHLDLGASLAHLNSPNHKFFGTGNYDSKRPSKLSAYAMLNHPLGDDLDIIINGLYSSQEAYEEIVVNGQVKLYLSGSKDKALFLGAGYRLNDAWYPMLGLQFGQFYGAFNFDLNNSAWDVATEGQGGPELSLRYIWAKVPSTNYKPCLIY